MEGGTVMRKPHKRLLWIWEIYAALLAILLGGVCVVLFVLPIPAWICWTAVGVFGALVLALSLIYLPLAYMNRSFGIQDGRLVVKGGVIYLFHKTMPLESVKYVMTLRGPLEQLLHMTVLAVFSAGSLVVVSGLTEEDGEDMRRILLPQQRGDGDV